MASRSWIIPFPEGYHGRDGRLWYGLIPCHDDDCLEWQIVRRMTNGVWYASCDKKHPQIRVGGCGAKYEWGGDRTMPPQTLETLATKLDDIRAMPPEFQAVLADAWGLSVDQLLNGDFNHGNAETANNDQAENHDGQETDAAEIPGADAGSAGGPGGESPGNSGADAGAAEGSGVDAGSAEDGLASVAEPLPQADGAADDDGGAGPGEGDTWGEFERLYGGD